MLARHRILLAVFALAVIFTTVTARELPRMLLSVNALCCYAAAKEPRSRNRAEWNTLVDASST